MKKVAIVGLGWLGMPLALSLTARGWQVTGSKTTQDGVEAARMCGIDSYPLRLEPQLVCDTEDLDALMNVDALVITLPARRTGAGEGFYLQAVQEIVDTALAYHIPRIVFTSSTSVYGNVNGTVKENSPRLPQTASGQVLKELEDWLHNLPGTSVDILRLAGLVGPSRHPGRFFAGKSAPDGQHVVNLVHLQDVVAAIELLLQAPKGGQLNIEIAFQAVNGVAQRRGRFKELCRRRGKAPLFFQGIQDHEDIQQWFHRYPLTVCESPLADHSIGITSGSGYWYSNPSSLQIRLPSTILPWPPSGLSLNTGGGRPSSRAICG